MTEIGGIGTGTTFRATLISDLVFGCVQTGLGSSAPDNATGFRLVLDDGLRRLTVARGHDADNGLRSCFWARLEFNERMEKAFMDSKGIFIASLTGVLIVALSIGGCEKKEEAPPPAPQAQQPAPAPAPQAQAPAAVPAPEAAAPAAPPAPQAAEPKPVLASSDGEKPGSRVEIQELKRVSGGTVMLRFALINDADQTLNVGYDFGAGSTSDIGTVGGVHLIEPVGKKKYLVIRDSENKCDCSRGVKDVAAKSRVNLWARFPAPPDNVEKIGVVIPHFSPMDDVPLSR